jgi:peptide/nickel transport system substrate-binding protein
MNRQTRFALRGLRVGPLLTIIVLAVSSCGSGSATKTNNAPERGGTLTYAVDNDVPSWLPQKISVQNGGEDRGVMIYDTLLLPTPSPTGSKPNIASMASNDGTTWTMTLRKGVTFTDGTPLDAQAVKFNVGLTRDPKMGSVIAGLFAGIKAVNVVDPSTVQFVLMGVNGSFPIAFTGLGGMMVSPTAYQADPAGFGTHPIGAGPFILKSWTRGAGASLVRNPNYWDSPKPYLDQIEISVLPDNITRGQAVAAGQKDLADVLVGTADAITDTNGKVKKGFAFFGTNGGAAEIVPNQSRAPWNDVRIRQAIALSFDESLVNQSLFRGTWNQQLSCPPFTTSQPECLKNSWSKPDLNQARQLVQQYQKDGHTLKGPYQLVTFAGFSTDAQLLQQMLHNLGIEVQISLLQVPQYLQAGQQGNFDLLWVGEPPGSPPAFYRHFTSTQGFFFQHGTPDPEADMHMQQAVGALTAAERIQNAQWVETYNAKSFMALFYRPYVGGLIGKSTVDLGSRYAGTALTVPQDIRLKG